MKKLLVFLMFYSINALAGGDGENKIPPPLPPIGKITAPTPAAENNQSKAEDCAQKVEVPSKVEEPKNADCTAKIVCQCEPKAQPKPVQIVRWRTKVETRVDNGALVKAEQELADARREISNLKKENERLQGYLAKKTPNWDEGFKPVQRAIPASEPKSYSGLDGEVSFSLFGGVGPDGILPYRFESDYTYDGEDMEDVRLSREYGPVFGGAIDWNAFSKVKLGVIGLTNNTWLLGAGWRFNTKD